MVEAAQKAMGVKNYRSEVQRHPQTSQTNEHSGSCISCENTDEVNKSYDQLTESEESSVITQLETTSNFLFAHNDTEATSTEPEPASQLSEILIAERDPFISLPLSETFIGEDREFVEDIFSPAEVNDGDARLFEEDLGEAVEHELHFGPLTETSNYLSQDAANESNENCGTDSGEENKNSSDPDYEENVNEEESSESDESISVGDDSRNRMNDVPPAKRDLQAGNEIKQKRTEG